MSRRWWITITPTRGGEFVAWATTSPTPRNADLHTMLYFKGEVHFAYGDTPAAARDRLESELPA